MKAIALGAFGAALLASAASAAPLNATTIGSAEVSSVGQVRTRNLHRLVSHGQHPSELGMALGPGAEQTSAPRRDQLAVLPPSTLRTWPVTNEAWSDAIKTIALASSPRDRADPSEQSSSEPPCSPTCP